MTGTTPHEAPGNGIDSRHLLLVGAGPCLGVAVARRFAQGGYRVTLVARSTDSLGRLTSDLADTGADIDTISADASDPEDLHVRLGAIYRGNGAPGLIVYNAVMRLRTISSARAWPTSRRLTRLTSSLSHRVAAPAMRAAGIGTILVTGGGFADHPIPGLATVSLGKAALRSAATIPGADLMQDGIRVATLTIAGRIVADTPFAPERIAERYWDVVHSDEPWQPEYRFTG